MRILDPIWFAAAALAIPILAMYMLKLRRKEIEVSSTLLWTVLLRDRQANTPWQKLKRNLLLFLQLLILTGLFLALTRPALLTPSIATGSIVILLDGSASMNALDEQTAGNSESRFENAQAVVRGLINELQTGATMTLILAANPPVVLANAESDSQLLLQALNEAKPGSGSADWATAFAITAGAAGQSTQTNTSTPSTTIVVISDGGIPSSGLTPLPGEVRFIPVGQADDNLAIRALAIRPLSDRSSNQEIYASISNYSAKNRDVVISFYSQLDLSQAPLLFHSRQLNIPAQANVDVELSDIPADAVIITARLSPVENGQETLDVLPIDDTAFAVSPQARSQRIYLLSQDYLKNGVDNQFILRILFAFGYSPFRASVQGQEGERSALLPPDAFDLYILDGALPVNGSGQIILPPSGSLLLINPPENPLIASSGFYTPTGEVSIANNPLTTFLDWSDVYISQSQKMTRPAWGVPLVTDDGADIPLVFAGVVDGRRVAVLSFNLHASDLPLHVAYPVLMSNLLNYLLPPQAIESAIEGVTPDSTVTILTRPDANQIAIGMPDGSLRILNPTGQSLEFNETGMFGLYAVNTYVPGEELPTVDVFAVNLFDERESNITPRRAIQIGQAVVGAAGASTVGERELWPFLALAALIIILAEWWVYHRPSWRRGEKINRWVTAANLPGKKR